MDCLSDATVEQIAKYYNEYGLYSAARRYGKLYDHIIECGECSALYDKKLKELEANE